MTATKERPGLRSALRFQAVEKIEEQRVRLDVLSGFVGKHEQRARKVELFIDGANRGGVNGVEERDPTPPAFPGGLRACFHG